MNGTISKKPDQRPSPSLPQSARILIVDDHELLRQGMRSLIDSEPTMEVCGDAAGQSDALSELQRLRPDLVVVDISLQEGNGIDVIKEIKQTAPETHVVVSSMHSEGIYGETRAPCCAAGYVSKHDPARRLVQTIKSVLEGKLAFSSTLVDRVMRRTRSDNEEIERSGIETLSDRELEVFRHIGGGMTSAEIAQRLNLSASTVNTYRERLKTKLDVANATELVHRATQWVMNQG